MSYLSPILPSTLVPDLHTESRRLTMFDISPFELVKQLYHSDWAQSKDATPWDCSFAAGEGRDEEFNRFRRSSMGSRTWYRSYCMSYVSILICSPDLLFAYYFEHLMRLPSHSWTITIRSPRVFHFLLCRLHEPTDPNRTMPPA